MNESLMGLERHESG